MRQFKYAAGSILLFLGQAVFAQEKVDVSTYSFSHEYKTGEKVSYMFEDLGAHEI
mgnify:CR=1 FL=1